MNDKDKQKHIDDLKYWCETNEECGVITIPKFVCDNIIKILDNVPTVEDERIGRVLESIQTVIDNTNGKMDNVSKAIRNTAKFIRYTIDGETPNYENVEGEDCGERPTAEWLDMPFGHHCSNCHKGTIFINREYAFCPNCGAQMGGEEE